MIYEYLFQFFDSIPTGTFILWFPIIYFSFQLFTYNLLQLNEKFRETKFDKQTYILVYVMESMLLAFISYIAVNALYRGDISAFDSRKHAPNPQIMINMATMYVVKDLANLLINKRIASTTILHHIGVFSAYIHVLSVLTDDHAWKEEGLFKSFIAYASFQTLAFPFESFLAFRFFIDRYGILSYILKRYALLHNLACFSCNMVWQCRYLVELWSMKLLGSYLVLYFLLIMVYVQEEIVSMKFLWNYS